MARTELGCALGPGLQKDWKGGADKLEATRSCLVLKTPAFQVQDPTVLEKASRDVTGWITQASDRSAVVAQFRRCSTSARACGCSGWGPDGQMSSRFSLFWMMPGVRQRANGATAGAWMRAIVDVAGRVPGDQPGSLADPRGFCRRQRGCRLVDEGSGRRVVMRDRPAMGGLDVFGGLTATVVQPASKRWRRPDTTPTETIPIAMRARCLWTLGVLRLAAGSSCSWESSNGRRPLCSGDQEGGDGFNATVLICTS